VAWCSIGVTQAPTPPELKCSSRGKASISGLKGRRSQPMKPQTTTVLASSGGIAAPGCRTPP
jgi:hypothetical protein